MIDPIVFLGTLFFPIILMSFLITLVIIPRWIDKAKREKLVGKDIHKIDKREVAEGGGVAVLIGFVIGIFLYISLKTFFFETESNLINILGLTCVLLFAGMVGAFDDLLGWKRGLSKNLRMILLLFAAIPLIAINAGTSFVMGVELGLIYPLILIPIAIIGTTTTYNFLAGFNGLEASQGIIILTALAYVTYTTGNPWLSVIAMCMVASLFAFYLFNKYPAKIFPGDTLTYPVGALIGCIAILGNIELIALFFFIPYALETILKLRGKLKIESFGKVNDDGSLSLRQPKIYGLEHIAITLLKKFKPSKKAYEWEVHFVINAFQILVIVLGFILFLI